MEAPGYLGLVDTVRYDVSVGTLDPMKGFNDDNEDFEIPGSVSLMKDHSVRLLCGCGCLNASRDKPETSSVPVDDVADDGR